MKLEPAEIQFDGQRPWRTLWGLYWPERRWVGLALLSYLFKASPVWILPVVTANIIDILSHRQENGLRALWLNAIIGAVSIIQNIPSAAAYVTCLSKSVRNVEIRLRSTLVRRLQMLSINYHYRANTAALQTKLTRDVESIEMMSRQLVDVGFFALVTILVALAVTAWRMPAFVPVFLLFLPLIWLIRKLLSERLRRHNESLRREIEDMNSLVHGMINMIPVTRAHAVEEEEIARVENQFGQVRKAGRSFDFVAGTWGATAWVMMMLFNLAGLTTAAILSYQGILPLTAGDIVLLAGYFNTLMAAMMQLNAMLPVIARGFDGLKSVGEVLECPDVEENRGKQAVTNVRGEFEFDRVSFGYVHGTDAPPALRDVSFKVGAGETVGIIGPSGSGKSTLACLIIGFYRPASGRILLDGRDMNTLDLRTFRRHLALVSQQTILFNGTLRENIVYGLHGVGEAALQRAIADANAAEFIRELPRGLETEIGQGGVQLSGGQRQRIAIARALLRDPRVLILDEATSSLDTESEAVVQEALEKLMIGRTTFIIAHRHAVLRRAGRIFKLDHGVLTQQETAAGPAVAVSRTEGPTFVPGKS
jgi:ATP-binding cassette subfamily B protein